MFRDYLQIQTLSIVFIGDFNPVIIQPSWLAAKRLIREGEGSDSDVEVQLIHNDLVRFNIGEWCAIDVTKKRFELRSSSVPHFEAVRDLAIGIFQILKETPMNSVGINHLNHYALPDQDIYFKFGDRLAPLSNWSDFMNNPRVMLLEINEEKSPGKVSGGMRIKITPSDQKLRTSFGVLINTNDSYQLEIGENGRNSEVIKKLAINWDSSFKRVSEMSEKIWSKINV